VVLIEADKFAYKKFAEEKPDIVFNIAEGLRGINRESQIPSMLEMLNIPYTASDPLTLSTCLDKSRAKEILSFHNVSNPRFEVVNSKNELENSDITFPIILKPVAEGSSKGIFNSSLLRNISELNGSLDEQIKNYQQSFIAEEYLPGREFTVGILGNGESAFVLPIVEINFDALPKNINPIYSYEAKWILDGPDNQIEMYKCPAVIDTDLTNEIEKIALNAYHVLQCKDWSRIDIRLDAAGKPNIIEVNPLPGILPDPKNNSCLPKAARTAGFTYDELINHTLNSALVRYGMI
jgi:D-alanine-D-alanine ligase